MKKKFKIVMADDDLDDQELMKEALKDSKVEVQVQAVYNGLQLMDYLLKREAYRNLDYDLPDLILLDLNMPLMDGFEVLKQIRQNESLKNIAVYVITTSRSMADKRQAIELGTNGFYSKGASSKDIKRIVQEVCMECFSGI
jgi:two-component system response regulator